MRLLYFLILVTISTASFAQLDGDYRTDQVGNWSAPTTWEVFTGGVWQKVEAASAPYLNITPTATSGAINIQHTVTVTVSVSADQVTLTAGNIVINAGQTLSILDGPDNDFVNNGTGASSVTTTGILSFAADAVYEHARNGGTIPFATWGLNSTCYVTGITSTNPTLIAANAYENFIWECPGQSGARSLNGNLTIVNKDLLIANTNDQILRLTAGAAFTLDVARDFTIVDNSRIQFCTSANPVTINVAGNFDFSSTSAVSSLKTTGVYTINIAGDFSQNSGTLNLSGGANQGTFNIEGNFIQSGGIIGEIGAGSGVINFNGTGDIQSIEQNGTIITSVSMTIENPFGIALTSNVTLPSNLSQLTGAGDIDLNGFILTINGTLSQASGAIASNSSSELILQGSGTLPASSIAFAGTDMNRLQVNQNGTLQTTSPITITNLDLYNGTFDTNTISIAAGGTIERRAGVITATPSGTSYNLLYNITALTNTGPEMPSSATVLNNLTKQGTSTLTLNQALVTVNGDLTLSAGTFALAANSLNLAGNFTSNATLTATAGSVFTTTGTCSLTGTTAPTLNTLTVNGTLTPSVGYRVNGNYNVGIGATVNAGSGTVTFGGTTVITNDGNMNLNAVTILTGSTMTAPVTTMGIAGNFTTTGTLAHGGGTILFNGTTNLNGIEVYNNVTVSGTVTSTGNSSQTIAGNLINNGSFSLGTGNLTWSGSGSISGSGNTTVGDVNVTGTSCTYLATGTLTLNDDLLGTGSFDSSAPTAGTVIFAGAGSAIGGAGAKTLRNISVTGSLTPTTTYTLVGAGGIDISGTLFTGGTIIFAGTTQTVTGSGSITFNIVTTNVGSDLTITPSVTINGNLTGDGNITSASTITFVGLTMSGTGTKSFNNVTVGTGTLTPNANYSIAGNLVVNGTLASGNATTTFNGTTTISGSGTTTFNFLTITGTLTSSAGTISVVRDFTNNGTFNHNNGTVSFSTAGTVQQNIAGSQNVTFNNLIVNNVGVASDLVNSITSPATVSLVGTLSFGENASVFDADGLSGTSSFTILSTGDNPAADGSVAAITGSSSISGNITVQRYMSVEGGSNGAADNGRIYRYLSAPILNPLVTQIQDDFYVTGSFPGAHNGSTPGCTGCTTNPSLYYYDSSIPNYVAFPGGALLPGVGYSAFIRNDLTPPQGGSPNAPVIVDFTGQINSGAVLISSISPNSTIWNLVGNPYPSPIAWNNAGVGTSNIAAGIAIRDNGAVGSPLVPLTTGDKIATGQAFWVRADVDGAAQLTFNETDKTTIASTFFYKMAEDIVDEFSFKIVRSDGKYDETFIRLSPSSTISLDQFDIPKKNSSTDLNNDFLDITSVSSDGTSYLLNVLPQINCGQIINLNFEDQLENGATDLTSANFTISMTAGGAMKAITWVLHDSFTNTDINLGTTPNYDFTISGGGSAMKDRFYLTPSAPSIDVSSLITASPTLCASSEAMITVASQNGVTYDAEINGVLYPNLAEGNGEEVNIFIKDEWMNAGANSVRIRVNSGCDAQFLTTTSVINKVGVASITQTTGGSLCKPGAATISAVASSGDASFNWYDSEDGTQVLSTSAQWVTPILDATTTYYVSALNESGCESPRVAVMVEVSDVTLAIEVENYGVVCSGQPATLLASSNSENSTFRWYESLTSLTPINEGSSFTTPALPKTTKYYVSLVSSSGCEGARTEVYANVASFNPQLTFNFEKDEVCSDNVHSLTVQGAPAGSTYEWFDSMESTTSLLEGSFFNTPPLSASKIYYATARSEMGCVSSRFAVEAKVSKAPATVVSMPEVVVCPGTEKELTLVSGDGSNTTYNWYESTSSDTPVNEGMTWVTPPLESTTSYFVSAVNGYGCESEERKKINVNVVSIQEPVIESPGAGLLRVKVSQGDIQWYFNDVIIQGETENELIIGDQVGAYSLVVNYNGCQTSSSRYADQNIVTSLEMKATTYYVYPNPASERIMIEVVESNPVKAQLIDGRGASIEIINLRQSDDRWKGEFNVSDVSAGNYFIRLTSGKKSITHQVIIRK